MEKLLNRILMFVLLGVAQLTGSCIGPGGKTILGTPADDATVLEGDSDFTTMLTREKQGASLEADLLRGESRGKIFCKSTVSDGTRSYAATLSVRGV